MAATRGVDWELPLTVPPDWVIRLTIAPSVPTLSHPGNTEKKPPGKRRLKSQNGGGSNFHGAGPGTCGSESGKALIAQRPARFQDGVHAGLGLFEAAEAGEGLALQLQDPLLADVLDQTDIATTENIGQLAHD